MKAKHPREKVKIRRRRWRIAAVATKMRLCAMGILKILFSMVVVLVVVGVLIPEIDRKNLLNLFPPPSRERRKRNVTTVVVAIRNARGVREDSDEEIDAMFDHNREVEDPPYSKRSKNHKKSKSKHKYSQSRTPYDRAATSRKSSSKNAERTKKQKRVKERATTTTTTSDDVASKRDWDRNADAAGGSAGKLTFSTDE